MGDYRFAKGNNPNSLAKKSQRAYRPLHFGEDRPTQKEKVILKSPKGKLCLVYFKFCNYLSPRQREFFDRLGGINQEVSYSHPVKVLKEDKAIIDELYKNSIDKKDRSLMRELYYHTLNYISIMELILNSHEVINLLSSKKENGKEKFIGDMIYYREVAEEKKVDLENRLRQ